MQKILVIDDDPDLRNMVVSALKSKGYEVFEAEGGAAGIQLARAQLPDLIISDVVMEDTDGYETLTALRNDPMTRATPFILMTGRPNQRGMRHGMVLGADDYLPKPFSVEELHSAVAARLKQHQAVQKLAEQKLDTLRATLSLALPHELRTPLNGILGFAEMLSTGASAFPPLEIASMGRAILESANRLHRMIENFLLFAQIQVLATDPVKIQSLRQTQSAPLRAVGSSTAWKTALEAERTSDLEVNLPEINVAISEENLAKIIDELVSNAFKFSQPGSSVQLAAATASPRGAAAFTIRDAGIGMSPAQIADIGAYMQFERKIREQQGSGLGLVIAKSLTELHGGSLRVQSRPEKGTEITVTLPLAGTN
ncbi:MAG: response regulator [Verrucomicrobia bacterium]|nr:response regulator [Verrucomicrobiota bacterium]